MRGSKTIKPVTFEERIGVFRTVNHPEAMGEALMTYCNAGDADYQRAAASCIALMEGDGDPVQARADFVAALVSAGIFIRD